MFDSRLKPTGSDYTAVVAWLAVAVVFIPALFLALQASWISVSLATAGSAVCTVMAIVQWKTCSGLGIPSIETQSQKPK